MDIYSGFWIILTGAFAAAACGMLGCFLILRRMAMLGDAISHAILPGIVLAFLLSNSMSIVWMFLGAALIGILTTFIIQTLNNGGVQHDAALGVTFTALFALGVIGVSSFGEGVHLDTDCVLEGEIALTPLDVLMWGSVYLGPRAVWVNGGLLLLNLIVIGLFYKEFKLCAFDPAMAAAVGIPITLMHYVLMTLVAVTTVGAFESVGVILVVAMLIAPAATAYLLTDRLSIMLLYSIIAGALTSFLGYFTAVWLDSSIAGAMGSVAGLLFALALFFSPTHGVFTRWLSRRRLSNRVAEEDVLLWVGRQVETGLVTPFSVMDISEAQQWLLPDAEKTARRLVRKGLLEEMNLKFSLTKNGNHEALELIKRHRLYESFLEGIGYAADHTHDPADRVEHHITPDMTEKLDREMEHPNVDPHGKAIPR
ncbi:MAG: metal ABC transporter permease [Candidatus Hinthialibacter antarcticus]|nr:metal ABC transporter permease [Candidatus Hinthialibacter antarcticus]